MPDPEVPACVRLATALSTPRSVRLTVFSLHAQECDTFWHDTVHSRISRLAEDTLRPTPIPHHTSPHDASTACGVLLDATRVLQAKFEIEKAAIARAEKELSDAYETALQDLRQHHNHILPVARIPPEILAAMFTYLSDSYVVDWSDTPYQPFFPRKWLAVTFVCQRWRRVALDHSRLWARIDLEDADLEDASERAAVFLARSRGAPLSLSIFPDEELSRWEPEVDWRLKFLKQNISRTECLYVIENDAEVSPELTEPAPLLRTLYLSTDNDNFDDNFLGVCAPELRHFRLLSWTNDIPWMSPVFQHLISLDLQDPEGHLETYLNDFLYAVVSLRALERLSVAMSKYSVLRDHPGEYHRVAPTNLTYLEVTSNAENAAAFIPLISLPPHAIVRCHINDESWRYILHDNWNLEQLERLFQITLQSIHSHADSVLESSNAIVSLDVVDTHRYRTEVIARKDTDRVREPALSLIFDGLYSVDHYVALVPLVLQTFSSAHLEELMVKGSDDIFDQPAWRSLQHVPAMRRVTAKGSAAVSLCAALTLEDARYSETPSGGETPNPPPFLPALSTLVLAEDSAGPLAEVLPLCLAARAQAGYPLQELDVARCDVDDTWVTRVRETWPGMRLKWNEDTAASHETPSEQSVPCFLPRPGLAVLVLKDVHLDVCNETDAHSESLRNVADTLPNCLAARVRAGCRMEELDVVRCDVEGEWVARARELLPWMRVVCDEGARERARLREEAGGCGPVLEEDDWQRRREEAGVNDDDGEERDEAR
ncbi:hypothetical protein FA95DRAFT_1599054 [Auriscalpium vulgare]|uniref:Uncharacterized protein n=1 Tax=Auriscalpium vulgare TaxID=40419 RepID=A0ACB8RCH8_9AGAM|nr:hypothetical protein FA95DRAFT_1599054 [Auriscalpium vulgare]